MGNMIRDGLSWLAGAMKANLSETVSYQRGTKTVTGLQAVIGQTQFRREDLTTRQTKLQASDADFIFAAADIVAGGIPMPPIEGDVILYQGNAITPGRYEAHAPPGERIFKLDGFGIQLRVHTKYAGT